jgi:Ferritin-like domain
LAAQVFVRVFDAAAPQRDGARTVARREFLQRAVVVGGTLVAGGVAIGGLPPLAVSAPSPEQDARILNFVLLIEYLEAAFYGEAESKGLLRGELSEFARVVGEHERAHVAFLKSALGRSADPEPAFDFGNATTDADRFTAAAAALEDTAVAAYNGQATNLTRTTLASAATIVSVEARHAAWIRSIIGQTAAPDPTDTPLTEEQVRTSLAGTGYLKAGG